MKNFWTTALGAFVGTLVAFILFTFISIILTFISFIGLFATLGEESTPTKLSEKSVLCIDLSRPILEKNNISNQVAELWGETEKPYIMADLIKSIENAADNKNIEGIYLKCTGSSNNGVATNYAVRKVLNQFKESGKWIYSYADNYTQSDYYLASVSDSLFINPEGSLDLHGITSSIPHFKKLLDKIGVEMQIFKVGTFKSAVEPFILTESSDANRFQTQTYIDSMWKNISLGISGSRNISVDSLNNAVNSVMITKPVSYLAENKLIDGTCYKFNFEKKLKETLDIEEDADINFVSPEDLNKVSTSKESKNKIAVLYAIGDINSQSKEGIVADDIVENILEIAKDDDIRGLVMRVNSGGGSAYDSEQIWAALETYKETGKPFAVSMGDYAASGGYYISCGADKIFAEPTTLTGSIGIFGMIPNTSKLRSTLGINISSVSTNQNAAFSIDGALSPIQKIEFQKMVERGYELFTTRCADGRNMPMEELKAIAEGRVWDGESAKELGLVDELGSLNDAVKWVASELEIDDYSVKTLPTKKDLFDELISSYLSSATVNILLDDNMKNLYNYKSEMDKILNLDKIQAVTYINVEL